MMVFLRSFSTLRPSSALARRAAQQCIELFGLGVAFFLIPAHLLGILFNYHLPLEEKNSQAIYVYSALCCLIFFFAKNVWLRHRSFGSAFTTFRSEFGNEAPNQNDERKRRRFFLLTLEVEVALFLGVALTWVQAYVDGSFSGRFSPTTYFFITLLAVLMNPASCLVMVIYLALFQMWISWRIFGVDQVSELLLHGFFLVGFSIVYVTCFRALQRHTRSSAKNEIKSFISKMNEEARAFRLFGAPASSAKPLLDDVKIVSLDAGLERAGVDEIHHSMQYALDLLHHTLGLHTAALLWRSENYAHYKMSTYTSNQKEIYSGSISPLEGIFGVIETRKQLTVFEKLKPSFGLPYYGHICPIKTLAAVPILDQDEKESDSFLGQKKIQGLLLIDRLDERAFTEKELYLAQLTADHCLRAVQNERLFLRLKRAKLEQGKLYGAAKSLSAALSENEVTQAGVKAAREIASFDLAVVTTFDSDKKIHRVVACDVGIDSNEWSVQWAGSMHSAYFTHNTGLVSMVVEKGLPLPYRGHFEAARQMVFSKKFPLPELESLFVLPLIHRNKVFGTMVVAAKRRGAFTESVRSTLDVLASHLALSLSNARMLKRLEELATTDGLTGLLNKRAMFDNATQKMAAAKRFSRRLTVLVVDIDFFKKVNDTYGHDKGDEVIRGLGEILKRQKRDTDLVARFGGEEFVILCEQTDEAGAFLLAERIRKEFKNSVFDVAGGQLSVTCSIGIATMPHDGCSWDQLFKAADEALYISKRSGRDKVSISEVLPSRKMLSVNVDEVKKTHQPLPSHPMAFPS